MRRDDRATPLTYIGELFALLAAWIVGVALWIDDRSTHRDHRVLVAAALAGLIPAACRPASRGRTPWICDGAGAAALVACAVAEYRIGGLAYLVPAFFLLVAFVSQIIGRGAAPSHRTAKIVLGLAALLCVISLFDLGGAVFIVIPVVLPFAVWAGLSLRRV